MMLRQYRVLWGAGVSKIVQTYWYDRPKVANLMGKVTRLLWNWLWWVEEKHDGSMDPIHTRAVYWTGYLILQAQIRFFIIIFYPGIPHFGTPTKQSGYENGTRRLKWRCFDRPAAGGEFGEPHIAPDVCCWRPSATRCQCFSLSDWSPG